MRATSKTATVSPSRGNNDVDLDVEDDRADLAHALELAQTRWANARAEKDSSAEAERRALAERDDAMADAEAYRSEHERLSKEVSRLVSDVGRANAESERLRAEADQARSEAAAALVKAQEAAEAHDRVWADRERLRGERDALRDQLSSRFIQTFQSVNSALRRRGIDPRRLGNLVFGRR